MLPSNTSTSLEQPSVSRTNALQSQFVIVSSRYFLLSLFVLSLSSCAPLGIGGSSSASSSNASRLHPSNPGSPEEGAPEKASGLPTTTGQESDINRKTSPDAHPRGSLGTGSATESNERTPRQTHSSDILQLFPISGVPLQALSVDNLGQVYIWDLGEKQARELLALPFRPETVAYDQASARLAVSHQSTVQILSADSGKEVASLRRLRTRVAALQFQPQADAIIIGGADGEIYRWKFGQATGPQASEIVEKELERYFGHGTVVSSIVFHPLGRVFFSGDWNGVLSAWLPFDADLYAGSYDENLFGLRAFSEKSTRTIASRASRSSIVHLAVTPDGEALLVASQDGSLEWWKVRGFSRAAVVAAHKGLIYSLAISPQGKRIATLGRDGKIQLWKLTKEKTEATGLMSYSIDSERAIEQAGTALAFATDDLLVVGDKERSVSVIRLE